MPRHMVTLLYSTVVKWRLRVNIINISVIIIIMSDGALCRVLMHGDADHQSDLSQ